MSFELEVRDSRLELARFLDELEAILRWAVDPEVGVLSEELASFAQAAWPDIPKHVFLAKAQLFDAPSEYLVDRGLTGPQLQFKLAAFHFQLDEFQRVRSAANSGPVSRLLGWIRPSRRRR